MTVREWQPFRADWVLFEDAHADSGEAYVLVGEDTAVGVEP